MAGDEFRASYHIMIIAREVGVRPAWGPWFSPHITHKTETHTSGDTGMHWTGMVPSLEMTWERVVFAMDTFLLWLLVPNKCCFGAHCRVYSRHSAPRTLGLVGHHNLKAKCRALSSNEIPTPRGQSPGKNTSSIAATHPRPKHPNSCGPSGRLVA